MSLGTAPASRTVTFYTLYNRAPTTSITDSWLSATLSPVQDNVVTMTVSVDTTGLAIGDYTSSIRVSIPDVATYVIPVTLRVIPAPLSAFFNQQVLGGAGTLYLQFPNGNIFGLTSFPFLYDFNLNTWLYYFASSTAGHYTTNPRLFANMATAEIFAM